MRLFLHGFLGCKEDWNPLLHHFGSGLAIDLPLQSNDIPGALHEAYPEADLLVGYSAGGRIALEMQARFPGAYRQVIAISAHTGLKHPEERLARRKWDQQWIEQLNNGSLDAFLDAWYAQPLFASFRKSPAFQKAYNRRLQGNGKEWAHFLETHGTGVRPTFEVDTTAAFIYGSEDLKYAALYRTLRSFKVPNAGHVVHLERPAECATLLENIAHDNKSANV